MNKVQLIFVCFVNRFEILKFISLMHEISWILDVKVSTAFEGQNFHAILQSTWPTQIQPKKLTYFSNVLSFPIPCLTHDVKFIFFIFYSSNNSYFSPFYSWINFSFFRSMHLLLKKWIFTLNLCWYFLLRIFF